MAAPTKDFLSIEHPHCYSNSATLPAAGEKRQNPPFIDSWSNTVKASLFYLPSIGSRAEIEAGMAGMRPDLYQRMLRELTEQIKLADELGYDSVSFTEHHFHIEGFEVSQNPVLLDLYFAMQTKRIRVGQLGIVLPAANPIRVAEDIAMLDHMTGGRAVAGFARGYQRRWVDIMAQQTHDIHGALPHQHDEVDAANRAAFEENFQIIKKAWTEEMLTVDGKYWKVPARETPWTLDTTAKYGKGVENGMLRAVGVVPKPLQKPHPDLFLPFASSENSIRWAAKEGVTAILPSMLPVYENRLYDVYAEVSGKRRGLGTGLLRDVIIADTDEEAMALWRDSGQFTGRAWFEPFGFRRGLQDLTTGGFLSPEDAIKEGYVLAGSVDTVIRGIEANMERQPVDWMFCYTYNGLVPHPVLMKSIEQFWTKVMPRFA
jgi:alkanesulfonate monooxygenase SsuD/methylene tetrahydromethanopterin reductase-like flavin-dependent oxidoreductase (luciferase family)